MIAQRFCGFCQISGFAGPHDHYVRASRQPNAPVTCPRLLATECSFCHKMGHTAKYCGERLEKEAMRKNEVSMAEKTAFNQGEWMTKSSRVTGKQKKAVVTNTLTIAKNNFDALNTEIESSDSEMECEPAIAPAPVYTGPSWAQIAKSAPIAEKQIVIEKRPEGMSWADWDDEE